MASRDDLVNIYLYPLGWTDVVAYCPHCRNPNRLMAQVGRKLKPSTCRWCRKQFNIEPRMRVRTGTGYYSDGLWLSPQTPPPAWWWVGLDDEEEEPPYGRIT